MIPSAVIAVCLAFGFHIAPTVKSKSVRGGPKLVAAIPVNAHADSIASWIDLLVAHSGGGTTPCVRYVSAKVIAGRSKRSTSGKSAILATRSDTPATAVSKHPATTTKKTVESPEDQLCSLNVSDLEIQKVLELVNKETGMNIFLMTNSPAKVTIHVEKMRLIDLMRHICALTGFAYLDVSGAYVFAQAEALKAAYPTEWLALHPVQAEIKPEVKEPPVLITQIFVANYVKASQLLESIKKLIPTDLDVIAAPGQESPSVSNVDPSEKTGTSTVSVSQDSGTSITASRMIVFRGPKAVVEAAVALAKQLDVPRQQVSIAVTIHDISDDAVKDLGLDWNFSSLTLTETPASNGISVGKLTRSPMTFNATIAALETRDVARLLASPNISVLDGEKAFILIGDRVNYPQLVGYSSTNSPIFSVQTERVGIYLQVAASISTDGFITLSLYPQVSLISGYLNVNGASYPQVSSREAQTTLRVKSGEMIVLGGLLQDQDIVNVNKVPILAEIPLFGELFKHRTKTKNKSQVIITIQPVISQQTVK